MGQQTETADTNEWADHTIQELRDLRDKLDDRLDRLNAEPVNYYSAGYGDTYLAAMSQVWGINVCREERDKVVAEIDRRQEALEAAAE
jgi:hypothetical protein